MAAVHFKSDLDEALHASASALHRIGALDDATMRDFDAADVAVLDPSAGADLKIRPERSTVVSNEQK